MLSGAQQSFVEAHLGPVARVEPRGRQVYALSARSGARAFLKISDAADKHRREVAAYQDWAPRVDAATPRLLAASTPLQAILLSYLDGWSVASSPTARDLEAAGRALASLHALPHQDADPVPLSEALLRRARAIRAEVEVAPTFPLDLAAAESALGALQAVRRVPCHRDYMPYNWRWTLDGRFGLLDFEHARPDYWAVDVARLAPHLGDDAAAFWRGYGRTPSPAEMAVIDALATLDAARTWVWATRHPDADDADRIRVRAAVESLSSRRRR